MSKERKLKELTEKEKENIACTIDNEGFWYALTDGGYLKPEDIYEDKETINAVKKAVEIIRKFKSDCPDV